MALLNLKDIHLNFGREIIFYGASLQISESEKIGLIGPNGSGKTSLLKIIAGSLKADKGDINSQKGLSVAYLPQEPEFDGDKTITEELYASAEHLKKMEEKIHRLTEKMSEVRGKELKQTMKKFDRLNHEFELAGGYDFETKLKEVTAGLGLKEQHHKLKTSQLSGGQLSRLGLAQVLLTDAQLLLLDEPTNHLDWNAIIWLEKYLKNTDRAALIVSHDRFLLDRVITKTAEINNAKIDLYTGNFSTYKKQSEIKKLQQERQAEKNAEFIEKQEKFIEMNRNEKGMQKIARGRKKHLEKFKENLPDQDIVTNKDRTLKFNFGNIQTKSNRLDTAFECQNLTKKYGDLTLFENLDLDLFTSSKLGIIGPNGTGKSTFLEMAIGRITPSSGTIKLKNDLTLGYLDQAGKELVPENTVLEEIRDIMPSWKPEKARTYLGTFLFSKDEVFKKVGNLSGGEKNRLAFAKLVLIGPDFLILDEPTNHLDMQSIEALENALTEYSGTAFIVSHDRYFLNKIADRLLIIGANELGKKQMGSHQTFDGTLAEYFELIESKPEPKEKAKTKTEKKKQNKKQPRPEFKNAAPAELKKFNTWTPERIEKNIEQTEGKIADLKKGFEKEDIFTDHVKLNELQKKVREKQNYLELLYRAYERKIG